MAESSEAATFDTDTGTTPHVVVTTLHPGLPPLTVARAASTAAGAERLVIVAGRASVPYDVDAVRACGLHLSAPVLPDLLSGLRLGRAHSPLIGAFDLALSTKAIRDMTPDVVIMLGRPPTSKRLLSLIDSEEVKAVIHVDLSPANADPMHRVTDRIVADPNDFLRALTAASDPRRESTYLQAWLRCASAAESAALDVFSSGGSLNEPAVARVVSENVPADHHLFVGSSMPIRDMDTFASTKSRPVRVFGNRGASGIDGSVATTVGIAAGSAGPVTAVIGDLALLHDLNSLAMVGRSNVPIVFVVVNNDGGGIFSMLPIATNTDVFEKYYGTPHGMSFKAIANAFGLSYAAPENVNELVSRYASATSRGEHALIEVRTDRRENARLHKAIRQALAAIEA